MKSAHRQRRGGSVRNRSGVLRNSISVMAGSLSSMSAIRCRWMIALFSRATEREIPPQAIFLPKFETATGGLASICPVPSGFQ